MTGQREETAQYELQIELMDIVPKIWRRVVVPKDMSLSDLHDVIQKSMGWDGSHLHGFKIGKTRFGGLAEDFDFDSPDNDELVSLSSLVKPREKLEYLYDFGDDWWHRIRVVREIPPSQEGWSVRCLAGARACPFEDCGGVLGYEHLLAALSDPNHPDHEDRLDWTGGAGFAAEAFDVEGVNRRLDEVNRYLSPSRARKKSPRGITG